MITAPLLHEPALDRQAVRERLGPVMKSLGYPYTWAVREDPRSGPWGRDGLISVDFTWSTKPGEQSLTDFRVSVDWRDGTPDRLFVILYQSRKAGLTREGWLRWRALKEALEASPIVHAVAVDKHPAANTPRRDWALFSKTTGIPLPESRGEPPPDGDKGPSEGSAQAPPVAADVHPGSAGPGRAGPGAPEPPAGGDLPPRLKAKGLLMRASWRIGAGDAAGAQAALDGVQALRAAYGFDAPAELPFRQAQVNLLQGRHAEAERWALAYAGAAGPGGTHYGPALELEKAARIERQRLQLARWQADEAPRQVAEVARLAEGGGRFRDPLRSGGEGPLMAALPAGWFQMGSLDDWWVRRVDIARPFAIGVHEVTFDDWDACAAAGGCGEYRPEHQGWHKGEWGRGRWPVIHVSWEDARSYARWLSSETGEAYRLPSEAEWEYAARAGSAARYSWGDEVGFNRANCSGCRDAEGERRMPHALPVGSFPPNAFGLHDLHGNVREWVQDCRSPGIPEGIADGSPALGGDCTRRVIRGGDWFSSPWFIRSAFRWNNRAGMRENQRGFRIARDLRAEELRRMSLE